MTQRHKKVLLIFPREKGIKLSNDALYPFPILLGLTLLASLFIGFESLLQENPIELPTFSILTPFPGTPLRKRPEEEERVFGNE